MKFFAKKRLSLSHEKAADIKFFDKKRVDLPREEHSLDKSTEQRLNLRRS